MLHHSPLIKQSFGLTAVAAVAVLTGCTSTQPMPYHTQGRALPAFSQAAYPELPAPVLPANNDVHADNWSALEDGVPIGQLTPKQIMDNEIVKRREKEVRADELYKEARPENVLFLSGDVKDENGEAVTNAEVEVKYMNKQGITKMQHFVVDSVDGHYAAVVTLKRDEDVVMTIKAKDMVFDSHLFEAKDTVLATYREKDVEMKEIEVGAIYRLNDIHYPTSSAEINKESKLVLQDLLVFLNDHPGVRIEIRGHTDDVGSTSNNLALSTDRAFSVRAWLQENDIEKNRLASRGYGETLPLGSNDTDAGRALNRRTEFKVTKLIE